MLFVLIIDEITRHVLDEVPLCILFRDDIVLIDGTRKGVSCELEAWREALASIEINISRPKLKIWNVELITCEEKIMKQLISRAKKSKKIILLARICVHYEGDTEDDVRNRIATNWLKWRNVSRVLRDRLVPIG